LTREDITFAWLKLGWNTASTNGRSAAQCIDDLHGIIAPLSVSITSEELISAISFVWSVAFSGGALLNNNDLITGSSIRPMAAELSENWAILNEAITQVSEALYERGLLFREHYFSVNAIAFLWAWLFLALRWRDGQSFNTLEKDSFAKQVQGIVESFVERWLLCSTWAGVWAASSGQTLSRLALRLSECGHELSSSTSRANAIDALRRTFEDVVHGLESDAITGINNMSADDRNAVRTYYAALWLWNRLDCSRWGKAKIVLRPQLRAASHIEVDHVVSWKLWELKVAARGKHDDAPTSADSSAGEVQGLCNELGNCMLLEKNFNISKGAEPLIRFLSEVHEFATREQRITEWGAAMALDQRQIDSTASSVVELSALFVERTKVIKDDLIAFCRGSLKRVDI